jgi:hypothetical protein
MAPISYRRHRFPPLVIQHAVWLYLRFTLSYRDVEELLAERGLDLSYETVRSWVLKFGPAIARGLRRCAESLVAAGCVGPPRDRAQRPSFGVRWTLRWRKTDSNHWSPVKRTASFETI